VEWSGVEWSETPTREITVVQIEWERGREMGGKWKREWMDGTARRVAKRQRLGWMDHGG
jgi:hypothetical protein